MKKLSRKQVIISISINNADRIIASVRVANSRLSFSIFNFILIYFLFWDIGLGFSMMQHVTVINSHLMRLSITY